MRALCSVPHPSQPAATVSRRRRASVRLERSALSHHNRGMSLLRFTALVALALWVGGLVALGGLGAPVLFDVLGARDPTHRLPALVFGAMFARSQYVAWLLGLVILASLGARAAIGPRPRRFGPRMWIVAGMLAASLASVFLISPRIEALRTDVSGPVSSLSETDPRRVTFGRLHGLSTTLMAATILAGLGLIWTEMRDPH